MKAPKKGLSIKPYGPGAPSKPTGWMVIRDSDGVILFARKGGREAYLAARNKHAELSNNITAEQAKRMGN